MAVHSPSPCGAQVLLTVVLVLLAWAWAPGHLGFSSCDAGSVAVVYVLCSPLACGIFPDQRSNWCSLYCKANSSHWTTKEAQHDVFEIQLCHGYYSTVFIFIAEKYSIASVHKSYWLHFKIVCQWKELGDKVIKEGEKQLSMCASEKDKLQRMKTARRRRWEQTRRESGSCTKRTMALEVNKSFPSVARGRLLRLCILINEFRLKRRKLKD